MVELLTVKRVDPGSSASDVRLLIGQGIHTHSLARTGLRLTLTVLKDILERRIALARSFVAVLTDGIVDAVPRGQQMEHMVSINALRYVLAEGSNVEGKGYPALDGRWLPPFIYHAIGRTEQQSRGRAYTANPPQSHHCTLGSAYMHRDCTRDPSTRGL